MEHRKQYLVTADVQGLMGTWAQRHGFTLPDRRFFANLHQRLLEQVERHANEPVEVRSIDVRCLADGVRGLLHRFGPGIPVVIMDRAMSSFLPIQESYAYDATRCVRWLGDGWDEPFEGPRPGCLSLEEQAGRIAHLLHDRECVVVDDGCFEGHTIRECVRLLRAAGITVRCAVVAVMFEQREASNLDLPIHPVFLYPQGSCLDWVCERDFMLGVPEGGRAVSVIEGSGREYCAPYLTEFGDVSRWGTIAQGAASEFTRSVLEISLDLYLEIGRLSGRSVQASNIERWPFFRGQPLPSTENCSFVTCIRNALSETEASVR